MKLCGEFIVRKVMDDIVAIPVGQTLLQCNNMILLNDVSKIIWDCLDQGMDLDHIVMAVTDAFDVSDQEAREDIVEFCSQLRSLQLLED